MVYITFLSSPTSLSERSVFFYERCINILSAVSCAVYTWFTALTSKGGLKTMRNSTSVLLANFLYFNLYQYYYLFSFHSL